MSAYILSILGIVVAGIIIDVVIPAGNISKYIKGVYAIFVVAVLINPIVQFISKTHDYKLNYTDYELDAELIEYIFTNRVESKENEIEMYLNCEGFLNIDIKINFSINKNEIVYNSCLVNLENLSIKPDKQHINKYEFITKAISTYTNLTYEEIEFYEW